MLTRVCVENTAPYWAVKADTVCALLPGVVYVFDDSEGTTFITSIFITIVRFLERFQNELGTVAEKRAS